MKYGLLALFLFTSQLYAAVSVCTVSLGRTGDFIAKWKVKAVDCVGPRNFSLDEVIYPSDGIALSKVTRKVLDLNWKLLSMSQGQYYDYKLMFQGDELAAEADPRN